MTSILGHHSTDIPLGQIIRLPCRLIVGTSNVEKTTIDTIANELATAGKNILPVIVKYFKAGKYTTVLNNQIFIAAQQAKLDFIYCIVVNDQMAKQLEIEIGQSSKVNINQSTEVDQNNKINLNDSTETELITIFENIKSNITGFSKIDSKVIAHAIVQHRAINRISSLIFLTKLKCGIGKTKLSALADQLIW